MKINGVEITFGADPEVFVKDLTSVTRFMSAHNLIPGTKAMPFPVKQGAVQVDGMALEFNIDPASTFEEFDNNLTVVQQQLRSMIGDREFLEDVTVYFDKDFVKDVPMVNLMLGCEPDYNGWTLDANPEVDGSKNMRTVGGHLHIGGFETDDPFHPNHFNKMARLARILDETLGVYSILWDKDDNRRSMYGKAGSFRPKRYGMEYRPMSNQWIFKKPLVEFVFNAAKEGVEKFFQTGYEPSEMVRSIIDNSDRTSSFFSGNEKAKLLGV
jgi:hypothetical protein